MEKKPRPKLLIGETTRWKTGCGNLYVTVNKSEDGSVFELFATLGKAGGCPTCQNEALTRAITVGLRYNVPIPEYVKQLGSIQCPNRIIEDGIEILSCPHVISLVLGKYTEKLQENKIDS